MGLNSECCCKRELKPKDGQSVASGMSHADIPSIRGSIKASESAARIKETEKSSSHENSIFYESKESLIVLPVGLSAN